MTDTAVRPGGGDKKRKRIANDTQVRSAPPGMNSLGQGLYLQVQGPSQRSWLHRYTLRKKTRYMGLGPYPAVSLAEARKAHKANLAPLARGEDPLGAREAAEAPAGLAFREAAAQYIANHKAGWKDRKHAEQWKATLEAYAFPTIGDKLCRAITVTDVEAVLRPSGRRSPRPRSGCGAGSRR